MMIAMTRKTDNRRKDGEVSGIARRYLAAISSAKSSSSASASSGMKDGSSNRSRGSSNGGSSTHPTRPSTTTTKATITNITLQQQQQQQKQHQPLYRPTAISPKSTRTERTCPIDQSAFDSDGSSSWDEPIGDPGKDQSSSQSSSYSGADDQQPMESIDTDDHKEPLRGDEARQSKWGVGSSIRFLMNSNHRLFGSCEDQTTISSVVEEFSNYNINSDTMEDSSSKDMNEHSQSRHYHHRHTASSSDVATEMTSASTQVVNNRSMDVAYRTNRILEAKKWLRAEHERKLSLASSALKTPENRRQVAAPAVLYESTTSHKRHYSFGNYETINQTTTGTPDTKSLLSSSSYDDSYINRSLSEGSLGVMSPDRSPAADRLARHVQLNSQQKSSRRYDEVSICDLTQSSSVRVEINADQLHSDCQDTSQVKAAFQTNTKSNATHMQTKRYSTINACPFDEEASASLSPPRLYRAIDIVTPTNELQSYASLPSTSPDPIFCAHTSDSPTPVQEESYSLSSIPPPPPPPVVTPKSSRSRTSQFSSIESTTARPLMLPVQKKLESAPVSPSSNVPPASSFLAAIAKFEKNPKRQLHPMRSFSHDRAALSLKAREKMIEEEKSARGKVKVDTHRIQPAFDNGNNNKEGEGDEDSTIIVKSLREVFESPVRIEGKENSVRNICAKFESPNCRYVSRRSAAVISPSKYASSTPPKIRSASANPCTSRACVSSSIGLPSPSTNNYFVNSIQDDEVSTLSKECGVLFLQKQTAAQAHSSVQRVPNTFRKEAIGIVRSLSIDPDKRSEEDTPSQSQANFTSDASRPISGPRIQDLAISSFLMGLGSEAVESNANERIAEAVTSIMAPLQSTPHLKQPPPQVVTPRSGRNSPFNPNIHCTGQPPSESPSRLIKPSASKGTAWKPLRVSPVNSDQSNSLTEHARNLSAAHSTELREVADDKDLLHGDGRSSHSDDGVTLDLSIAEVSNVTLPTALISRTDKSTEVADREPRDAGSFTPVEENVDPDPVAKISEASSSQMSEAAAPLLARTLGPYQRSDELCANNFFAKRAVIANHWSQTSNLDTATTSTHCNRLIDDETCAQDDQFDAVAEGWDLRRIENSFPVDFQTEWQAFTSYPPALSECRSQPASFSSTTKSSTAMSLARTKSLDSSTPRSILRSSLRKLGVHPKDTPPLSSPLRPLLRHQESSSSVDLQSQSFQIVPTQAAKPTIGTAPPRLFSRTNPKPPQTLQAQVQAQAQPPRLQSSLSCDRVEWSRRSSGVGRMFSPIQRQQVASLSTQYSQSLFEERPPTPIPSSTTRVTVVPTNLLSPSQSLSVVASSPTAPVLINRKNLPAATSSPPPASIVTFDTITPITSSAMSAKPTATGNRHAALMDRLWVLKQARLRRMAGYNTTATATTTASATTDGGAAGADTGVDTGAATLGRTASNTDSAGAGAGAHGGNGGYVLPEADEMDRSTQSSTQVGGSTFYASLVVD